jgi:hypothetical protein
MFRPGGSALLVVLAACLAVARMARGAENATTRPVVVVELFTSEGCSSCPPADALLGGLGVEPALEGVEIIPLGLHVDYFNYLGWSDPFSSAQFSERQQQYARIFNSDEVYTPQMIVDGSERFVGSDQQKAIAAIINAAGQAKGTVAINLSPDAKDASTLDCNISIDGIHRSGDLAVDVLVAVTEDDLTSEVARGENAGRKLHHSAVVRTLGRVATIRAGDAMPFGASTKISILPAWRADRLHVAVLVQDPQSGKILAAGGQRVAGGNGESR